MIALGFGFGAASPNIWVAAACCVVGGIGNGMAVVCNALLVQRGASDEMRGRALTFVMSATFAATAIGIVLAGALMPADGARWVWLVGGICCAVAAVVAYALMRATNSLRLQPSRWAKPRPGRTPSKVPRWPGAATGHVRPSPPACAAATGARSRARSPRRERRPARVRPRPRDLSRDRQRVRGRDHRPARRRQVEPRLGARPPRPRSTDTQVGVVSVDPSSPFTQGALLGDRIRLADHFLDPGVFIRSMGTRGHLGGLAEATLQALLLLDAAGKDLVFLETVGTGQSEVEVIGIADTVLLVLMPGSGDSIQALKAGIMEIPDVIAINKMDHPAAKTMLNEVRSILALDRDRELAAADRPHRGHARRGHRRLWEKIEEHRAFLEQPRAARGAPPRGTSRRRSSRSRRRARSRTSSDAVRRRSRAAPPARRGAAPRARPADRGA